MARWCSLAFWALVFGVVLLPYAARALPFEAGAAVVGAGFLYLLPSKKWGLVLVYLMSVAASACVLCEPLVLFLAALVVEDLRPSSVLCLGYPAYRDVVDGGLFIVHDVFLRVVEVFWVSGDEVVFEWGRLPFNEAVWEFVRDGRAREFFILR